MLVRKVKETKVTVVEVRGREHNTISKEILGINDETNDLGKDLERDREEAGMHGASLNYSKAGVRRLAYNINRMRERSKGVNDTQRATTNR